MNVEVIVPYWAKDIDNDDVLVFIAFMHRMNLAYGEGEYSMCVSDVNTIVGKKITTNNWVYKAYPETKEWLKIRKGVNKMMRVELIKYTAAPSKGQALTATKEITIPRSVMVWVYLLGAFKRNLVTDDPFTWKQPKSNLAKEDRVLFNYFKELYA